MAEKSLLSSSKPAEAEDEGDEGPDRHKDWQHGRADEREGMIWCNQLPQHLSSSVYGSATRGPLGFLRAEVDSCEQEMAFIRQIHL